MYKIFNPNKNQFMNTKTLFVNGNAKLEDIQEMLANDILTVEERIQINIFYTNIYNIAFYPYKIFLCIF